MSFPRYPTYKDCETSWLGKIPEHWNTTSLKRIAILKSGDSITADSITESDEYPVYGGNGIRGYTGSFTHDGHYPIVGRQGALCGNVNYAEGRFWASEHAVVISPLKDLPIRWLGETLRAMNLNQYSVSAAQPGLSVETVGNLLAPLPPKNEQLAIASFLDRETVKIDALIAEQQRLIELLQEKRQAVISHAVTKGLNPNAPMRDSGVEWLGEVPEHWKIMGLAKTTLLLQTGPFGSQLGTADYKGEGVAVINPSNISEGSIDTSCGPFIAMNKALELERHKLYKGDLVIARRGEMGRCAVVKDGKEEKLCGTGSILVRPLDWMCTDFMAHIIRSEYSRASLSLNSVGSTMENLSAAIVGKLRIPVPPREEQVQIVDWIRSIASSYQCLANNSVRAIELLQERRSALISAAVTGQIDVRELAETETDKR